MCKLLLIPLLLAIPVTLPAQRMGFAHFSGHPAGFSHSGFARPAFGRGGYYGLPLFDPTLPLYEPLSSDYGAGYPVLAEAPVIVIQPATTAAAQPSAPPSQPAQPLMIELQGDRYVQVSGDTASQSQMLQTASEHVSAGTPATHSETTATPPPQRAATVLVFRDGHREQVSDYTIADGLLYASADFYTSGAWARKIALTSLNLPETVAANQSRAVAFRVPSAPNEVIVGP